MALAGCVSGDAAVAAHEVRRVPARAGAHACVQFLAAVASPLRLARARGRVLDFVADVLLSRIRHRRSASALRGSAAQFVKLENIPRSLAGSFFDPKFGIDRLCADLPWRLAGAPILLRQRRWTAFGASAIFTAMLYMLTSARY